MTSARLSWSFILLSPCHRPSSAGGSEPNELPSERLAAHAASSAAAQAVFSADDALTRTFDHPIGPIPGSLFATIRKLTEAAGVPLDAVLVESNDVWKQIITTARKKKCDVICMASHGRRGIAGVLLGSETHKVLTHSELPVLVLR